MTARSGLVVVGSTSPAERTGVHLLAFDPSSGALAAVDGLAGIAAPSWLTRHPARDLVYVASEADPGRVVAVRIDGARLRVIADVASGGAGPCHLAVDPDGRWLVASHYAGGTVVVLGLAEDGCPTGIADVVVHDRASGVVPERQERAHPHSALVLPDGARVAVADLGGDEIVLYRLDARSGRLGVARRLAAAPGDGPRHMAWSAGRLLVVGELSNTVAAYDLDGPRPGGSRRGRTVPETFAGSSTASEILVHGESVLVANRGHDSVAVLDARSLRRTGVHPAGGAGPRHVAVAPGGRHLLVANLESDVVCVLPLAAGDPVVGAPVAQVAIDRPACVLTL